MLSPLYNFPQRLSDIFALNESYWTPPDLSQMQGSALKILVSNHKAIANHYKYVRHMLVMQKNQQDRQQIIKQYKAALYLAELLEQIYLTHWKNHQAIAQLREQQANFRKKLNESLFINITPLQTLIPPPPWSLAGFIVKEHPDTNAKRLILARTVRMLTVLGKMSEVLQEYKEFFKAASPILGPLFAHLGWIAFIPRITSNLWFLFIHTVPGWWMDEAEKNLGWRRRLWTQLTECWPALLNDLYWFFSGLLNAFLFTGALVGPGIYFTVTIFWLDVVVSGIRSVITLVDLYSLKEHYESKVVEDAIEDKTLQIFIAAIDAHIVYETKRAWLAVANSAALFMAMSLTLPGMLAIAPLHVLIIAVVLVVAISVIVYFTGKYLDKQAPALECPAAPKPSLLTRLGMFTGFINKEPDQETDDCKLETLSLPSSA